MRQHIFRVVVDDRVDFGLTASSRAQRRGGRVHRRNLFRADQGGEFFRRRRQRSCIANSV